MKIYRIEGYEVYLEHDLKEGWTEEEANKIEELMKKLKKKHPNKKIETEIRRFGKMLKIYVWEVIS